MENGIFTVGKVPYVPPKSHQKSALNAIKHKNTGPRFFHNPKNSAEKNLKMIVNLW